MAVSKQTILYLALIDAMYFHVDTAAVRGSYTRKAFRAYPQHQERRQSSSSSSSSRSLIQSLFGV
jgi:hypothetical protein